MLRRKQPQEKNYVIALEIAAHIRQYLEDPERRTRPAYTPEQIRRASAEILSDKVKQLFVYYEQQE